ncbi:hypothetical protein [Citrobacter portucalensis]|uniref:hypothetical protein n=1 Tax=Citrobacter portucalensis TaxID=1639133 RepID=UPI003C2D0B7C
MEKRKLEEHVLNLSRPALHKLYGGYSIDTNQVDRPDAAIDVKKPHKTFGKERKPFKVGVEITTVDPAKTLSYLNDENFGRDIINNQINDLISNGIDSVRPSKKIDTKITRTYIYDSVKKKGKKYEEYTLAGDFKETIVLCFSDVIDSGNQIFKNGLCEWTNYLLSEDAFPFDKVIFVGLRGGKPVCVYDKSRPVKVMPKEYQYEYSSITSMQGPMLKFGKTYNLNDYFSQEPLIPQKKK